MSWRKHSSQKEKIGNSGRVKFLALFFVLVGALMVFRLFNLQILKGNLYTALALGQHELYQKLFPIRGSIYVLESDGSRQKLFPLVTNRDLSLLYAVPAKIENPNEVAEKLVEILGVPETLDREELERELFSDISPDLDYQMVQEIKDARLEKWQEEQYENEVKRLTDILSKENDPYEPLFHRLTDGKVEKILALEVDGLGFKEETWRFYPEEGMGGHVLGFWGFDGDKRIGKYGLEGYFDDILAGKFGEIRSERDVWGNLIAVGSHFLREKEDGSDLVLTIDRAIQYKTCQVLYKAVDDFEADSGSIIVLNPKTGAVLAMCSAPDFNPDKYYEVESINTYNNPSVFDAYEPGSIFKPFTVAAALDQGKITPGSAYEDTGKVVIGTDTLNNFQNKIYGYQTMTQVLEKSINTGSIWAMRQITPKVFKKYVEDFGFGKATGIKLDTEMPGDISNLDRSGEIYAATASYGQGITATPIQLISAFSALANGGKLMKPYIVSQVVHSEDDIENFYPQEVNQVISSKTSRIISAMLVSVVDNGSGSRAAVPGYRVAGKTGTANIANTRGGYSDKVATSFAGFAPFTDPKFVMLVRIDNPQYGKLGSSVAAPVFGDIAKFILQYYNVPQDG